MDYQETVSWLFAQTPSYEQQGATGYKEGLATTLALDEHTGHPHRHYATIHVAGTNGKGSVAHSLAACLMAEGRKVGLYTSPHLKDFRERIRVNGVPVSEEFVTTWVERHKDFFLPLQPSFFELTTAMAFDYFAQQGIDIAVIEVGLGGRLDCTNIITPVLSVITNISLDHTALLGPTLQAIAREKAGIIKPNVPVIIGEHTAETRPVFEEVAHTQGAPITFCQDHPLVSPLKSEDDAAHYQYKNVEFCSDLCGCYQLNNMNTVVHALQQLVSLGVIKQMCLTPLAHAAATTGLMGRWQTVAQHPTTICDTGHNPGAWQWLGTRLHHMAEKGSLHVVFGMVADKDFREVMAMLPQKASYHFCAAKTKRALPVEALEEEARILHLNFTTHASVNQALMAARMQAGKEGTVYVGGSTYVVAEIPYL